MSASDTEKREESKNNIRNTKKTPKNTKKHQKTQKNIKNTKKIINHPILHNKPAWRAPPGAIGHGLSEALWQNWRFGAGIESPRTLAILGSSSQPRLCKLSVRSTVAKTPKSERPGPPGAPKSHIFVPRAQKY